MNYIKSLFVYLFKINPGSEFRYYIPIFVFIGLLFLGSIAFSIIYNKRKKTDFAFKRLFKKTPGRIFWIGFIVLLLTLIRYEAIPYLSMRIWLYLTLVIFLYFVYYTIKTYKIDYQREKANVEHMLHRSVSQKENKYLPHKKKR